jgi:hypothetical protein
MAQRPWTLKPTGFRQGLRALTGDLVQRSIWWSDSGGEPLGDGVGTSRQTEESLPADMRLATMQAA